MTTSADEVPLLGGRLTSGVVRVGETVRRPSSSSSPFVARLLAHLEASGFDGAPKHLGLDEAGRDTFTYIHGWVPAKFQRFSDLQIRGAGLLLRGLHDATRGSELTGEHAAVCHHDPGPNNVVFQGDRPVAFIDFDSAAPGDPMHDFGYLAWTWCVSSRPDRQPAERQAAQLRLLVDAYGMDSVDRADVVEATLTQVERSISIWRERHEGLDGPAAAGPPFADRLAWSRRERTYLKTHRAIFASGLR